MPQAEVPPFSSTWSEEIAQAASNKPDVGIRAGDGRDIDFTAVIISRQSPLLSPIHEFIYSEAHADR